MVCGQLGFPRSAAVALPVGSFPPGNGSDSTILLVGACNGTESSLLASPCYLQPAGAAGLSGTACSHTLDAGVDCAASLRVAAPPPFGVSDFSYIYLPDSFSSPTTLLMYLSALQDRFEGSSVNGCGTHLWCPPTCQRTRTCCAKQFRQTVPQSSSPHLSSFSPFLHLESLSPETHNTGPTPSARTSPTWRAP